MATSGFNRLRVYRKAGRTPHPHGAGPGHVRVKVLRSFSESRCSKRKTAAAATRFENSGELIRREQARTSATGGTWIKGEGGAEGECEAPEAPRALRERAWGRLRRGSGGCRPSPRWRGGAPPEKALFLQRIKGGQRPCHGAESGRETP